MERNIIGNMKLLFTNQEEFFQQVKGEGVVPAMIALLVSSSIFAFVVSLFYSSFVPEPTNSLVQNVGFLTAPPQIVMIVLGSFVVAGIVHLFVRGFKGVGTYVDTYKVMTYGLVAMYVLGLIPLVGTIIGMVLSVIISIKGVKFFHKLSGGKAFMAVYMLPLLTVIVLMVVFALISILFLSGIFLGTTALG